MTPETSAPSRCVLLFARSAGGEARAKRLDGARGLFALARRRVVAAAAALPGAELVVVGPAGPELPAGTRVLAQRGGTFGERVADAFAQARALGFQAIVAVPTDAPGLGLQHLAAAFRSLASSSSSLSSSPSSVVLGPSPDGGVYLIGCQGDAEPLLRAVRWQTPWVFSDLAANARAAAVLAPLRDVDRRSDLPALRADPETDVLLARLISSLLRSPAFQCPEDAPAAFRLPPPACLAGRAPPPLSS